MPSQKYPKQDRLKEHECLMEFKERFVTDIPRPEGGFYYALRLQCGVCGSESSGIESEESRQHWSVR